MTTQERTTLLEQIQEEVKQLSIEGQLELLKFLSAELSENFGSSTRATSLEEPRKRRKGVILDPQIFDWLLDPANDIYTLEDGEPYHSQK